MIAMEAYETALAKKYGFTVKEDGFGHYIVRDPQMPKKKYVGGNLYSLMLQAVDERNRLKKKVMGTTNKVVEIKKATKEKLAPPPEPEPAPEPEPKLKEEPSLPFNSATRKGKLYVIKQVILKHPNFNVDQIMATLRADGYDIPQGTIATTRSDFLHSMRVIKDMNRWRDC